MPSTDNYVLRYAISAVLADACPRSKSPITLDAIKKYLDSTDLNYHELGGYTLRHLYVKNPTRYGTEVVIETSVLEQLGNDRETYVGQQILGEILLNLALQGRSYTNKVRIPMKPAMHSKLKPATRSDLKPAIVPI